MESMTPMSHARFERKSRPPINRGIYCEESLDRRVLSLRTFPAGRSAIGVIFAKHPSAYRPVVISHPVTK